MHDRRRLPRASRQWHAISTGAGELLLALVALVLVILPQVLVPGRLREEPPLIVPVIEATVFLVLLAVAAKPGPVPRCPSANPVSVRHPGLSEQRGPGGLVVVVFRTPPEGGAAHCDPSFWRVPASLWPPISWPSICSTGSLTEADRTVAWCVPSPMPDFQFPQSGAEGLAAPGWQPRSGSADND